jgi:tetratricopeptide (TPR) repeat protein
MIVLTPTLARNARIAAACLVALTVTGCAKAPAVFGTRAHFSPAFHGYVMATDNGSDDPGAHDKVLVLRDPLTGNKLRCREDVLAWRELHEDLAEDRVQDDNAAIAGAVTANTLFLAALVVQPVGALYTADAVLADVAVYERFRSDSATKLLARGIVLYRRRRYPQAARIIERALAKDGDVGLLDKAFLYLGLAYNEQGNHDRARLALSMFLDRAAVRDVDAYRNAEAVLRTLDVASAPCASTEPVELYW